MLSPTTDLWRHLVGVPICTYVLSVAISWEFPSVLMFSVSPSRVCSCDPLFNLIAAHSSCSWDHSYLRHVKASYLRHVKYLEQRREFQVFQFRILVGRRLGGMFKLRIGTRLDMLNTLQPFAIVWHQNCRFRFSKGSPTPTL